MHLLQHKCVVESFDVLCPQPSEQQHLIYHTIQQASLARDPDALFSTSFPPNIRTCSLPGCNRVSQTTLSTRLRQSLPCRFSDARSPCKLQHPFAPRSPLLAPFQNALAPPPSTNSLLATTPPALAQVGSRPCKLLSWPAARTCDACTPNLVS